MRLEEHLHPDRVVVGVEARTRDEALAELAEALGRGGVELPPDRMAAALAAREAEQSTVLGRGIAVPHAVLPELSRPVMLVAVTRSPVAFGPPSADPVRIFFALLSPPGHEGTHIRLLARICRLARHDRVLEALRGAGSPEEALGVLRDADREEG